MLARTRDGLRGGSSGLEQIGKPQHEHDLPSFVHYVEAMTKIDFRALHDVLRNQFARRATRRFLCLPQTWKILPIPIAQEFRVIEVREIVRQRPSS